MPTKKKAAVTKSTSTRTAPRKTAGSKRAGLKTAGSKSTSSKTSGRRRERWEKALEHFLIEEGTSPAQAKELVEISAR